MKWHKTIYMLHLFLLISLFACTNDDLSNNEIQTSASYNYLALGDSYTIGESVCASCRFPNQLVDSLNTKINTNGNLKIIAKTGWTTTNLITAIETENPSSDYDLVTLLIGVNNQYQQKPFSIYQTEFPQLLDKAIRLANGKKENVIVVSIPDYAFTPFGQTRPNPLDISKEIDMYNNFAKQVALQQGVYFQDITDITRLGLENPELVASDGLHPSQVAYKKFIERLFEKALNIVTN